MRHCLVSLIHGVIHCPESCWAYTWDFSLLHFDDSHSTVAPSFYYTVGYQGLSKLGCAYLQEAGQGAGEMSSVSVAELGTTFDCLWTQGGVSRLKSKDSAEQQQLNSLPFSLKAPTVTEAWQSLNSNNVAIANGINSQAEAGSSFFDLTTKQPNVPPVRPWLPCCQSRLHITPRDPKQSLKFWKTIPNVPAHPFGQQC